MKTLIIHPHDKSTHFLKPIYEKIPNKTVITGGWKDFDIKMLIKMHDRVIMLGHGSPRGLFGINFDRGFVIDESKVELLREKECIFIWCHADQFVKKHNLKGFYSGMFVSEVSEASMYGLARDKKLVDKSNKYFARILGSVVGEALIDVYWGVKWKYARLAEVNEIAKYNNERLGLL